MSIDVMGKKYRLGKEDSEWKSEWNCYLLIKAVAKEGLSVKWHLNKDLKKKREGDISISRAGVFQAKGTANAKTLGQEHAQVFEEQHRVHHVQR